MRIFTDDIISVDVIVGLHAWEVTLTSDVELSDGNWHVLEVFISRRQQFSIKKVLGATNSRHFL